MILRTFIDTYDKKRGDNLFDIDHNKRINEQFVCKTIKKFGDKYQLKLSIRELRHLFLTHFFSTQRNRIETLDVCTQMATSLDMINKIYRYDAITP